MQTRITHFLKCQYLYSGSMAGMPRVSGLLKKAQSSPQVRNLSFTVAGQGNAKTKAGVYILQNTMVVEGGDGCWGKKLKMRV